MRVSEWSIPERIPGTETLQDDEVMVVITATSGRGWAFAIKKAPLCAASTYFKGALDSTFVEAQNRRINLTEEEVSGSAFEVFVRYVETGKFSSEGTPVHSELSIQTFRNTEDPLLWDYDLLLDLYILGDFCDAAEFRGAVFQIIQAKTLRAFQPWNTVNLSAEALHNVCQRLPRSSPLRRFLTDHHCDHISLHPDFVQDQESNSEYPVDFLGGCLTVALRRMSARGCNACMAGRECVGGGLFHDPVDGFLCGYKPWCYFHEHGESVEEMRRCWEQRQSLGIQ